MGCCGRQSENMKYAKDYNMRKSLMEQLIHLVKIIQDEIKIYLDGIFEIIHIFA